MAIIGRKEEIQELNELYYSGKSELVGLSSPQCDGSGMRFCNGLDSGQLY